MRERIRRWGASPIEIPRSLLTVKYAWFVLLGVAVAVAASPSLALNIGDWLTPAWGVTVVVAGGVAAFGSVSEAFEPVERWASAALAILLLLYAFSPVWLIVTEHDWDRAAYSVTALALAGLPSVRAVWLLRRTGIRPARGPFSKGKAS